MILARIDLTCQDRLEGEVRPRPPQHLAENIAFAELPSYAL
jgi:hypothetical protein